MFHKKIPLPIVPIHLQEDASSDALRFIEIKEKPEGEYQEIETLYQKNCPSMMCTGLLIFDLDDVLTIPERKNNEFVVQPDGFINATLIDVEKISRLVDHAIEHQVALMILTARPLMEKSIHFIISLIEQVNGFHSGVGGFKKHLIYCSGRLVHKKDGTRKWEERQPKVTVIEDVIAKKFPYLCKKQICFADDMITNIEPVKKLGYLTLHVDAVRQKELSYFEELMQLITEFSKNKRFGFKHAGM